MTIKLTNFALVNIINVLEKFADKRLPQKISYAITRNAVLLKNDYNCYIKSINKLLEDYSEYVVRDKNNNIMKDDSGIPIVDPKVSEEFKDEISNLLNIEIDVQLYTIPENIFDYEDSLGRYDSLSASDIMNLQDILCDHDENLNKEST